MECTSITIHRALFQLSPPQRLLCVEERLGEREKKESARGTMGRGKGEERPPPFPSSHRPPRAFYFSIIATFTGIPKGSLYGEGRFFLYIIDTSPWPRFMDTKNGRPGRHENELAPPPPLPPHLWSLPFKVVYGRFSTWAGFPSLESTEKRKTFQKL